MNRFTCIGCDCKYAIGYLLNRPTLRICGGCRGIVLSYLTSIGFNTDQHILIHDLCAGSAISEDDCWGFYDCINQRKGRIVRLTRKEKPK